MIVALKCSMCNANLQVNDSMTMGSCEYCGTPYKIKGAGQPTEGAPAAQMPEDIIFARWEPDGFYYPGRLSEKMDDFAQSATVLFLDGHGAVVERRHIIFSLDEALSTLAMQGNWRHGGVFFKGRVTGSSPMVMHYDDGDVEQVELKQLRGVRPGEKPKGLLSRLIGS